MILTRVIEDMTISVYIVELVSLCVLSPHNDKDTSQILSRSSYPINVPITLHRVVSTHQGVAYFASIYLDPGLLVQGIAI